MLWLWLPYLRFLWQLRYVVLLCSSCYALRQGHHKRFLHPDWFWSFLVCFPPPPPPHEFSSPLLPSLHNSISLDMFLRLFCSWLPYFRFLWQLRYVVLLCSTSSALRQGRHNIFLHPGGFLKSLVVLSPSSSSPWVFSFSPSFFAQFYYTLYVFTYVYMATMFSFPLPTLGLLSRSSSWACLPKMRVQFQFIFLFIFALPPSNILTRFAWCYG